MKEHLYQQKINNKAMKSIQIYILCGLVLFSCFSCKEEDDIVPNPPMTNLFAPAEQMIRPLNCADNSIQKPGVISYSPIR